MYGIINNNGEWLKWIDSKTNMPVFSSKLKPGQVFFKRKKLRSVEEMLAVIKIGSIKEIPNELLSEIPKKEKFVNKIESLPDEEMKISEEYLFESINEKCKGCVQKCKQSSKVDIIKCPQYKSK